METTDNILVCKYKICLQIIFYKIKNAPLHLHLRYSEINMFNVKTFAFVCGGSIVQFILLKVPQSAQEHVYV